MDEFTSSTEDFIDNNNLSSFLKLSALNINSIRHKFHNLEVILDKQLLDILVINETKLDNTVDDSHFTHPNYDTYRRDRISDGGGGGLMVFVKKGLKLVSVNLNTIEDNDVEIIDLIIEPRPNYKISVFACYRPPHSINESRFFSVLEKKLTETISSAKSKETIILGDLNYNVILNETGQVKDRDRNILDEFINTHGYFNTIKKGTRLNSKTDCSTLLDVCLCDNKSSFKASKVIPCPFSDHDLIISVLDFSKAPNQHKALKTIRCLNSAAINLIKFSLALILSGFFDVDLDVNKRWGHLRDIIISVVDQHAPEKQVPLKPVNNAPWIDKELVCLKQKRDREYNKARKTKDKEDWNLYKTFRSKYASLFNLKKLLYFNCEVRAL